MHDHVKNTTNEFALFHLEAHASSVECVMFLLYVGVFYAFEIIMSVGIKAVSLSGATPIYSASAVQSSEV